MRGEITHVLEQRTGTSSKGDWCLASYVMKESGGVEYPKNISFEIFGSDKIAEANLKIGDDIIFSGNIESREWKGRWFNQVRAYKIEHIMGQRPQTAVPDITEKRYNAQPTISPVQNMTPPPVQQNINENDLPF